MKYMMLICDFSVVKMIFTKFVGCDNMNNGFYTFVCESINGLQASTSKEYLGPYVCMLCI